MSEMENVNAHKDSQKEIMEFAHNHAKVI